MKTSSVKQTTFKLTTHVFEIVSSYHLLFFMKSQTKVCQDMSSLMTVLG